MDALDKVFTAHRDSGLKLNASKCSFGVNRVTYLAHIISKHGKEVDPVKRKLCVTSLFLGIPPKSVHSTTFGITFADSFRIFMIQKRH
jgi:hypothetical protein